MKLLNFQVEAVKKMLHFLNTNESNGCYNAYAQGTGKCAMSLATVKELDLGPRLIITPAVTKLNWRDEIIKWSAGSYQVIDTKRCLHSLTNSKDCFTVVSYALARDKTCAKYLSEFGFKILICDESHALKGTTTLQTKSILNIIWPKIPYRICLSGTPFTQSVADCFTTFSRLCPSYFSDYFTFINRYCIVEQTPWGPKVSGIKRSEELKSIIREHFFLRKTKEEVLPELPDKIWTKVTLPKSFSLKLSKEEEIKHREYLALLRRAISSNTYIPQPPKHIATKRKEQGLLKVKAIVEFVKNIVDEGQPLVLFCVHLKVIEEFKAALKKYNPSVITGEKTSEERYAAVKDFQEGRTDLFIGQVQASGVGINLYRASCCVFAEPDYSPSVIGQCVDRLHRIGQRNSVNCYYFTVENSIDEEIWEVVREKAATFNKVLS